MYNISYTCTTCTVYSGVQFEATSRFQQNWTSVN